MLELSRDFIFTISAVCCMLSLTSCGQIGRLYLPEDPPRCELVHVHQNT